ncbi:hypothetical protein TWF225_003936 [Orbilia oligospora]|uniref:Uncharacterized protein n=1 Tax=Orbilia oligospora TaxID=2813651 RepID=A0A7C8PYN8_ORBOL|nr:hypothetical protein TWF751_000029 [Orbilia oligospora]KAF3188174.1 hypothetical protein TWF225_003936 [Orbilia oligospora]KAF3234311.1 hypothetical protein TWF128_002548 [Orbilia oligospora]KAF3239388.1 hypothetical protein TWF217_001303 [Orbilia oligospora]KAF3295583.1 hypothetical protein TWF132_001619 [Orbilia oligospora]
MDNASGSCLVYMDYLSALPPPPICLFFLPFFLKGAAYPSEGHQATVAQFLTKGGGVGVVQIGLQRIIAKLRRQYRRPECASITDMRHAAYAHTKGEYLPTFDGIR